MARFLGSVQDSRGEVSRFGDATSGLRTIASSGIGAVEVQLIDCDGTDWVTVSLLQWYGIEAARVLYNGPVSGLRSECFAENEL